MVNLVLVWQLTAEECCSVTTVSGAKFKHEEVGVISDHPFEGSLLVVMLCVMVYAALLIFHEKKVIMCWLTCEKVVFVCWMLVCHAKSSFCYPIRNSAFYVPVIWFALHHASDAYFFSVCVHVCVRVYETFFPVEKVYCLHFVFNKHQHNSDVSWR